MTPLPALSGLEAFEAVARTRSFSRAAAALGLSPSAVSHRITALEQSLGVALFTRDGRGVALTEAGRALVGPAELAFASLREAVAAIRPSPDAAITVSCSPSFAIRWLVPRLDRLRALHPDLDLRIAADDRLADLHTDAIDAAIRFGPGPYPGLAATRLTEERVLPVCSPALRDRAGLRAPADLARVTLLHDTALAHHPARVGWRAWLAAAGATGVDPEAGPRFSHLSLALEAALAGQGVALGRLTLVAEALASGALVAPFDRVLSSGLSYWWLTLPETAARPPLQAMARWLAAEIGPRVEAATPIPG